MSETLSNRKREFLARVIASIEAEPVNVPGPHDLARILGAPPQAIEEILRIGEQIGEVVRISPGLYYTPKQLDAIAGRLREGSGGKPFTPAEARTFLATNRRYAEPLFEHLDAAGITVRDSGKRTI